MELEVGSIQEGKVTSITKFGAFVALPGRKSGLVHISEIAHSYVSDVKDFLTEGQDVKVKIINIDEHNRINLSIKQATPPPARDNEHQGRSNGPRQGRPQQGHDRGYSHSSGGSRSEHGSGSSAPRSASGGNQGRAGGRGRYVSAPPVQAKGPASFEDQLKKFMQESDSRQSDLNRGSERGRSRRGNGRNRGNYDY